MEPELAEWLVSVRDDPYAFVMGSFPWLQPGTQPRPSTGRALGQGPDGTHPAGVNLRGRRHPRSHRLRSRHSKSTTVAQLVLFLHHLPRLPRVVTANTEIQLKTKTWAELGKWFNLLTPSSPTLRAKGHLSSQQGS